MDEADWTDVEPVMEEEGEDAACTILYTEEYKRAMGYYRALLKSGEVSQRALNLTTEIIAYNPAHYSVWHFRRKVLLELGADLHEELSYLEEVILDNPKNYQVWHHREKVVEHLGDASAEMEFTKASLSDDAKNYHAWTFRQWAMEKYNLFSKLRDGGLGFVDDLLQADVFNNSAWNHRFFVITKTTGFTREVVDREVAYTLQRIGLAPNNESSYNYLKGVLRAGDVPLHTAAGAIAKCKSLVDADGDEPSRHALAFLVAAQQSAAKALHGAEKQQHIDEGIKLCERLKEVDSVRSRYWDLVSRQLSSS